MQTMRETTSSTKGQAHSSGGFVNKLSSAAFRDLESIGSPTSYDPGTLLFSEKATPTAVYFVISGDVKLSINSSDGRRLIISIAKAGQVLGLSSALSGMPNEMTAEILYPSRIVAIDRNRFLGFLARHPEAYQTVTEELSLEYKVACEQLRTVGLSMSAPEKLARLLLDWGDKGQKTETGARFTFSLTHEEIGEFIGASRETVTRTLSSFKTRHLVAFHGSTLTIPNRIALESLAGI